MADGRRELAAYSSYGLAAVAAAALFGWAGHQLDGWLGVQPLMLMVGVIGGAALGLYGLYARATARDRASGPSA